MLGPFNCIVSFSHNQSWAHSGPLEDSLLIFTLGPFTTIVCFTQNLSWAHSSPSAVFPFITYFLYLLLLIHLLIFYFSHVKYLWKVVSMLPALHQTKLFSWVLGNLTMRYELLTKASMLTATAWQLQWKTLTFRWPTNILRHQWVTMVRVEFSFLS